MRISYVRQSVRLSRAESEHENKKKHFFKNRQVHVGLFS